MSKVTTWTCEQYEKWEKDQYEQWERDQLLDELLRLREEIDMLRVGFVGLEYILRDAGDLPRATSECRKVVSAILGQMDND